MSTTAWPAEWRSKYPSAPYIAPFAAFAFFLLLSQWRWAQEPGWFGPLRVMVLLCICALCWPRELSWRPVRWFGSIGLGLLVFVLWIAPDILLPGYRNGLLFSNAIVGRLHSSIPALVNDPGFVFWRIVRAVAVVPIVEELFWRAWLMRWLISNDFQKVPCGAYTAFSFWITAALFASEHGPYWDVGLLTGVIYNSWMIRTRSVADCILMHAITNAALSAYVIATRQWQYWQ